MTLLSILWAFQATADFSEFDLQKLLQDPTNWKTVYTEKHRILEMVVLGQTRDGRVIVGEALELMGQYRGAPGFGNLTLLVMEPSQLKLAKSESISSTSPQIRAQARRRLLDSYPTSQIRWPLRKPEMSQADWTKAFDLRISAQIVESKWTPAGEPINDSQKLNSAIEPIPFSRTNADFVRMVEQQELSVRKKPTIEQTLNEFDTAISTSNSSAAARLKTELMGRLTNHPITTPGETQRRALAFLEEWGNPLNPRIASTMLQMGKRGSFSMEANDPAFRTVYDALTGNKANPANRRSALSALKQRPDLVNANPAIRSNLEGMADNPETFSPEEQRRARVVLSNVGPGNCSPSYASIGE